MFRISAVLLALAAGCAHETPAARTETAKPDTSPVAAAASKSTNSCSTDADCGDKQLCIDKRCVNISPDLAECSVVRIHFPFNSTQFDDTEKPLLERSARCLKADHSLRVQIEGNADERGTPEYNLALGDQRAVVVAKYLEALGVSGAQLKTVSYGKENPVCTEHDEACWSKNRRTAVKPMGGK